MRQDPLRLLLWVVPAAILAPTLLFVVFLTKALENEQAALTQRFSRAYEQHWRDRLTRLAREEAEALAEGRTAPGWLAVLRVEPAADPPEPFFFPETTALAGVRAHFLAGDLASAATALEALPPGLPPAAAWEREVYRLRLRPPGTAADLGPALDATANAFADPAAQAAAGAHLRALLPPGARPAPDAASPAAAGTAEILAGPLPEARAATLALARRPAAPAGADGLWRLEGGRFWAALPAEGGGEWRAAKSLAAAVEALRGVAREGASLLGNEADFQLQRDGSVLAATRPQLEGVPLAVLPLPGHEGLSVRLFLADDDLLSSAANRARNFYLWLGANLLLFVVAMGGLAWFTLHRQMRLNRLRSDFIGTVSHELKTPLAGMRLLVETLLDGRIPDPARQREYLELIARENLRLSRLVENFLSFSRMERRKARFDLSPQEPAELARMAAAAVETRLQPPEVEFALEVAPDLPPVRADSDAFSTVLVNLLDNSLKYTRAEPKKIVLRVWAEGAQVCFAVQDNGIGIPRRERKRIFDRFYQVDQSLARKSEGAGLGLSIVRYIVEGHAGKIAVDSAVGEGTTFTVRLPAAPAPG